MLMVFVGELAVKLAGGDVEVGTSADRNSRQDYVTMRRIPSVDLLMPVNNPTKVFNEILLSSSYIYIYIYIYRYMHIYSQNYDNIIMHYYIHFLLDYI